MNTVIWLQTLDSQDSQADGSLFRAGTLHISYGSELFQNSRPDISFIVDMQRTSPVWQLSIQLCLDLA
jgi:hypothetical protein